MTANSKTPLNLIMQTNPQTLIPPPKPKTFRHAPVFKDGDIAPIITNNLRTAETA